MFHIAPHIALAWMYFLVAAVCGVWECCHIWADAQRFRAMKRHPSQGKPLYDRRDFVKTMSREEAERNWRFALDA